MKRDESKNANDGSKKKVMIIIINEHKHTAAMKIIHDWNIRILFTVCLLFSALFARSPDLYQSISFLRRFFDESFDALFFQISFDPYSFCCSFFILVFFLANLTPHFFPFVVVRLCCVHAVVLYFLWFFFKFRNNNNTSNDSVVDSTDAYYHRVRTMTRQREKK